MKDIQMRRRRTVNFNGLKQRGIPDVMTNEEVEQMFFSDKMIMSMWTDLAKQLAINIIPTNRRRELLKLQKDLFAQEKNRLAILDINALRSLFLVTAYDILSDAVSVRKAGTQNMYIKENYADTETTSDAVFLTTRTQHSLFGRDINNFSTLRASELNDQLITTRQIIVNSRDRNHSVDKFINSFDIVLHADRQGDVLGQIYKISDIRGVISINLIKAIFPNYISSSTTITDRGYIVLKLDKIDGYIRSKHESQQKAFCTLKPEMYYKEFTRSFITMNVDNANRTWPPNNALAELKRFGIRLYNDDGEPYIFRDDYFPLGSSISSVLVFPDVYDIIYDVGVQHNLNTNDLVTFYNVESSAVWYVGPIAYAGRYPLFYTDYFENNIINRPKGYNVTVLSSTTFSIRVTMTNDMFSTYGTKPANPEPIIPTPSPPSDTTYSLLKINSTSKGYMIIEKNQVSFTFEVKYLA